MSDWVPKISDDGVVQQVLANKIREQERMSDWAHDLAVETLRAIHACDCGLCTKGIIVALRQAEARGMKRGSEALTFKEDK